MSLEEAVSKLQNQFKIDQRTDFRGEITLELPLDQIEQACKFAKEQLGFTFLSDLSSVDNFGDEPRFEVVYELYSLDSNIHLRLKTRVSEDLPEVPSVVHLWATANWHEREVYDMMGIRFANHPDLRRILMWEGYPYYPLRKDFPLEGKPSEMPDVAFSEPAPLAGGPFVTLPSSGHVRDREPRARHAEDLAENK
jgi:NADH-quinone oxidoreductase subunit C